MGHLEEEDNGKGNSYYSRSTPTSEMKMGGATFRRFRESTQSPVFW